jgi:hypothetical protein
MIVVASETLKAEVSFKKAADKMPTPQPLLTRQTLPLVEVPFLPSENQAPCVNQVYQVNPTLSLLIESHSTPAHLLRTVKPRLAFLIPIVYHFGPNFSALAKLFQKAGP